MYKAYNEQDFVGVADAIREKTGKSAKLEFPDDFISEIEGISGGGSTNILSGTTAPTSAQGNNGDVYLLHGGFDLLDYIESDGTQYIDTLNYCTPNTKIEIEEQGLNSSNSIQGIYAGSSGGVQFGCYNSQAIVGYAVPLTTVYSQYDTTTKHKFIIDIQNGTVDFDGNVISKTYGGSATTKGIILFGIYASDRATVDKHNVRVYDYKYYDDGALITHLVPVKRRSDNTIGMLDFKSGNFYQNIGSGSFIAGPAKSASEDSIIISAFCKVNGAWQNLIGTDINDVNNSN